MDFLMYIIALIVVYSLLMLLLWLTIIDYKANSSKIEALIKLLIIIPILLALTLLIGYIIGAGSCGYTSYKYPFQ